MKDKTTFEMTYEEFNRWAAEYVIDGFLEGGLKQTQLRIRTVIGQQAMIFERNGGFQKETK